MKRFLSLLISVIMIFPIFCSFGCINNTESTNVIRVCNCEDYIDETLLDDFTAETGIEVIYSTYGTNENLYNELVINPNSYDLVVPSEYMIEKLAVEGRLNKLDFSRQEMQAYKSNVSSYIESRLSNIDFTIKEGAYKDEKHTISEFMVGYMWGTMGWVYNSDVVSEQEVSSWYGPFNNPALSKKITIKDAVRDSYIVGLAMAYEEELKQNALDNDKITEILNRTQQKDIDLVGKTLSSLKPMLYGFEVDSGKNDIVLGNIYAYVAWSGDAAYAIDVACGDVEDDDGSIVEQTKNLSYYVPDEGSNIWFDGFVMPSGSNNYDAVYKFLEFISRPDSVYRNMNYIGYTSMVAHGDFVLETEEEDGTISSSEVSLFDAVVTDWFDESEDLESGEGIVVDLSYFFGDDADYSVVVSEESLGRLIAQYPTKEIVDRCAVMSYFDSLTLLDVNEMWESVKGETFSDSFILIFFVIIILLAMFVVVYRYRERLKWIKLPQRKTTYEQRKNLKVIKKENLN